MAHCKHDVIGRYRFATGEHYAAHLSIVDHDITYPGLKAELTTERLDRLAHRLHHTHQAEGADVRLAHIHDFFRRTRLDELGQHLAPEVPRILDLAVKLAIRKSTCTAFAELHVGFRIQHRLAPQAPGVLRALTHDFAALQNNRTKSHLRQQQACEQAAWPAADHHWALRTVTRNALRRARDEAIAGVRCIS